MVASPEQSLHSSLSSSKQEASQSVLFQEKEAIDPKEAVDPKEAIAPSHLYSNKSLNKDREKKNFSDTPRLDLGWELFSALTSLSCNAECCITFPAGGPPRLQAVPVLQGSPADPWGGED